MGVLSKQWDTEEQTVAAVPDIMDQQRDIYANVEGPSEDDSQWRREIKTSERIYSNEIQALEASKPGPAISGNKHKKIIL